MRWKSSLPPIAVIAMLCALAVSGCASAHASSRIAVASAYVALPTTPGTTEAYLQIRNNGKADDLVAVHTSVGGNVQLLGPVPGGSTTAAMRDVTAIPIPADAMSRLDPNSYHLLITGAGPMQSGKDITLQLTFAHAGKVTVLALVTDPKSGGSSYFLGN